MKRLVMGMLAAGCVLTGCTQTTEGVVAQTTEPVSADGMTCADFNVLGERDQADVIDEILGDGPQSYRRAVAGGLAKVLCQAAPDAPLEPLVLQLGQS